MKQGGRHEQQPFSFSTWLINDIFQQLIDWWTNEKLMDYIPFQRVNANKYTNFRRHHFERKIANFEKWKREAMNLFVVGFLAVIKRDVWHLQVDLTFASFYIYVVVIQEEIQHPKFCHSLYSLRVFFDLPCCCCCKKLISDVICFRFSLLHAYDDNILMTTK